MRPQYHQLTRRAMFWSLGVPLATSAHSDNDVVAEAKAMERSAALTVFKDSDATFHRWRGARIHRGGLKVWPGISPDARAICWGDEQYVPPDMLPSEDHSFLTIDTLETGMRQIWLQGQYVTGCTPALSSGAEIIVARTVSPQQGGRQSLLALDLRSGTTVHDLTAFMTEFELPDLERISVSGPGTLVALASSERMQVLQIPTGDTVFRGPGRFPKLSPDGKRLAFIEQERLYLQSLANGAKVEFLSRTRVMGAGGWSPDGRFLLAGAWTKWLALEKRQIVVDTSTRRYGVIDTLGDGNYGDWYSWISTKLMARTVPDAK